MKKFILLSLVLIITCITTTSAQSDDKFINALRSCSSAYRESDTVSVSGINALSLKSLSGWKNNKCSYKETLKFNGQSITTTCNFTKSQIEEIVSVADAYYLTQKYSRNSVDTSSLDAIKNNPLFNVLNKYLQDSSVCSMGEL